ncbi:hypothetical protein C8F04DRAFT_1401852 [Mycena alexandri]|uniref:Uncharacterized protein n=1 Tax=Mycena alexandri TaxID=1745969 RepID=A0AAD6S9Z6_9AGAR|nr:hypothetical protein C8F04DRAFT_1401852 [Mycena alexandri]
MTSIAQTAANPPALARALPYAQSIVYFTFSSVVSLSRAIFSALAFVILQIIAHPFPLLLYILAPVLVFVQIFLDVFVYFPYHAIVYLADAFYPVYVLLGVACVTGTLIGLSGRIAVLGATHVLLAPPSSSRLLADAPEEKPRRV